MLNTMLIVCLTASTLLNIYLLYMAGSLILENEDLHNKLYGEDETE
jgi:hypothetical protein